MLKINMPKGVVHLNIIQIFSSIGFAVLLGTLNLYLQSKGMPIAAVNTLTASFFALNFLLHFLGGSLGGTYISYRGLFLMSLVLQIIGLITMSFPNIDIVLGGMACFITGSGLNVSCINMMLTHRFEAGDMRRRTAFSMNYSCMNIGFLLSFVVSNYFQAQQNYATLFIFAAGCIFIAFILHMIAWRHLADRGTQYALVLSKQGSSKFIGILIVGFCFLGTLYLMHHADLASLLIYIVFAGGLFSIIMISFKQPPVARNKALTYLVLVTACLVYAFVQGLMSTGLQNFVKYNTDMNFLGIHIEPSGFNAFESISVIIFGFILAKILQRRRQSGKSTFPAGSLIAVGLSFNILAFLMIPLGIWYASAHGTDVVKLYFPILLMVFVALAEIQVNAVNYAMAGELIKPKFQGIFTGYLFLNIALGNNIAGPFSNNILAGYKHLANVAPSQTNPMYSKMFLILSGIMVVITIIYALLAKFCNRYSH